MVIVARPAGNRYVVVVLWEGKMKYVYLLGLIASCVGLAGWQPQDSAAQAEIQQEITPSTIGSHKKRLVHLVWFKMKEGFDHDAFVKKLQKLDDIEVVNDFEVGNFANLEDPRAMSDFELVLQMSFESEADYRKYQSHPLHLQLKKEIGGFLNGPPVTYDYWSE